MITRCSLYCARQNIQLCLLPRKCFVALCFNLETDFCSWFKVIFLRKKLFENENKTGNVLFTYARKKQVVIKTRALGYSMVTTYNVRWWVWVIWVSCMHHPTWRGKALFRFTHRWNLHASSSLALTDWDFRKCMIWIASREPKNFEFLYRSIFWLLNETPPTTDGHKQAEGWRPKQDSSPEAGDSRQTQPAIPVVRYSVSTRDEQIIP